MINMINMVLSIWIYIVLYHFTIDVIFLIVGDRLLVQALTFISCNPKGRESKVGERERERENTRILLVHPTT